MGNYFTNIEVLRSGSLGISKTPLDTVVAPGEDVGYTLTTTTYGNNFNNYHMVDVLPFNGDKYKVTENHTFTAQWEEITLREICCKMLER